MRKLFRSVLLGMILCLFGVAVLASADAIEAFEGTWTIGDDAIVSQIDDNPEIDFSSAYFVEPRSSFYFETDFTILE
ncbi:MAG TPA: hypothetical protein PKX45_09420, partial [Bacillota bacterium]|nr:hypothetical protein [Bacillota bacterium]